MTILTELFRTTVARGRHSRVPHIAVWYDDVHGWRATCGGVFCDTHYKHDTPEDALRSAFANADRMAEKFMNRPSVAKRSKMQ